MLYFNFILVLGTLAALVNVRLTSAQQKPPHEGQRPSTKRPGRGTTRTTRAPRGLAPDRRTMHQLYKAAVAELGSETLVIYTGGDTPYQHNRTRDAFKAAFPRINIEIIVDFSKFHDARIDMQVEMKRVVADVVQLQTLQDFRRWKREGILHPYKPIGFNSLFQNLTDPEGAFTPVFLYFVSNNILSKSLSDNPVWPREAKDYLDRSLRSKLIMTYPNDDDAVLFLFKKIIDKYGWVYLKNLVAQNVTWVRGTQAPVERVESGEFIATMTSGNSLLPLPAPPQQARFVLPRRDPFMMWPQRASILAGFRHKEAAKLYLSWCISKERQNGGYAWSLRTDGATPKGYKPLFTYSNGNPFEFEQFMLNRAKVEQFKQQVSIIVGEPVGPNPNGFLGISPVKAVY